MLGLFGIAAATVMSAHLYAVSTACYWQRRIAGTVSTSLGQPVGSALVTLSGPADASMQTDEDGRFCFSITSNGRYKITVQKDGFESESRYQMVFPQRDSWQLDFQINPARNTTPPR